MVRPPRRFRRVASPSGRSRRVRSGWGRSRAAFALMAALLLSWIGGQTAEQVHGILEDHVVCEEHGQIEDVSRLTSKPSDAPSELRAALPAAVKHIACEFAGLARLGILPPTLAAAPVSGGYSVDLAVLPPPRGPPTSPLRYAPKTSPPSLT